MKLLRSYVLLNLAVLLMNAGTYVYQLLASRGLTVGEYGLWNVFISLYVIAYVPGLALNLLVARRVAELAATADTHVHRYIRSTSKLLSLYLSATLLVLLSIAPFVHLLVPAFPLGALLLLGLAMTTNLAIPLPQGALQGLQHFEVLSLAIVARSILTLVLGAVLLTLGLGLAGATGGYALGNTGGLLIAAFLVGYALRRQRPTTARLTAASIAAVPERYVLLTTTFALMTSMLYLDTLLAPYFLGAEMAGHYAVVAVASRSVYYTTTALIAIIVPRVATLAAVGRDTRPVLAAGLLLTLATALPIVLIFAAAPRLVLRLLFGSGYAASAVAPLLPWYAGALALLTIAVYLVYYFMACRRLSYLGALVTGITVLALNLMLDHEKPADLVRALLLGHGTSALLLLGLAAITSLRRQATPAQGGEPAAVR